jgi:hypothetical protein
MMKWHGKSIVLTPAQKAALEAGIKGFKRATPTNAFNGNTVAGLLRRGWLMEGAKGIIKTTDLGRLALQSDANRS